MKLFGAFVILVILSLIGALLWDTLKGREDESPGGARRGVPRGTLSDTGSRYGP